MQIIFAHFHFSDLTFFLQKKNLSEILSIYDIYKQPKLFQFSMKYQILQYHTQFRFHQPQSVPSPKIYDFELRNTNMHMKQQIVLKLTSIVVFFITLMHIEREMCKKNFIFVLECEKDQKTLSNMHYFHAFSFFGSHIFLAEKKSIRDIVNLWHLQTA